MSLNQEFIMGIVRNRSGQYSGEIDYQIVVERFEAQDTRSLKEIKLCLNELLEKVDKAILTKENYEKYR